MASSSVGIYDLPDEVLFEIFSKLTPEDVVKYAITVCKRWNDVVKENKKFWDHLQLTVNCDHFINYSYLNEESTNSNNSQQSLYPNELFIGEKDLEKVSTLRCIKLTEGSKAKSLPALLLIRILDIISKTCKNLEKFEFSRCFGATSEEFFQFLRERYSHISEVRFGVNCTYIIPYSEITRLSNITTLVSHDYAFKRSDLNLLADSCETLSCLWILFTRSLKVDDMLYFLDKKKNVLKELGLGMKLQDCILEKLKECHSLEVLFVADARYLTDVGIKSLNNLPRLKYCSLHGAVFEIETVWGMVKAASSGISTQLIILDLTGYKHSEHFVASIFREQDIIKRFIIPVSSLGLYSVACHIFSMKELDILLGFSKSLGGRLPFNARDVNEFVHQLLIFNESPGKVKENNYKSRKVNLWHLRMMSTLRLVFPGSPNLRSTGCTAARQF